MLTKNTARRCPQRCLVPLTRYIAIFVHLLNTPLVRTMARECWGFFTRHAQVEADSLNTYLVVVNLDRTHRETQNAVHVRIEQMLLLVSFSTMPVYQ